MKAAIVILNWNGKKFLERFLPSVVNFCPPWAEVIIADNASIDDSVSFLQKHFPQIRIIQHSSNLGFTGGYNATLSQIDAEYYILLNSDIEVKSDWLSPIIEWMDANPEFAACQPKLLSQHHPTQFEYAGAAGGFIDRWGYPFCQGRIFQQLEEDRGQYDLIREVFWATGACMVVRAKLYHEFGGLDEEFFAHMEEIDFCWRLKNAGYKIGYYPQSVVYHVGAGTLPKSSWKKTYLNFRNNLFLLLKNLPKQRLIPVFTIRIVLDLVAAMKFLSQGAFRDAGAVFKAYASFYKKIGYIKRKRQHHKTGLPSCVYHRSIVLKHYLGGVKKFSELRQKDFS